MAITASLIPATPEHAAHIAKSVRPADRDELSASFGRTPLAAMTIGLERSSQVMTGCADGEPVVMWGAVRASLVPNLGVPWMVGSSRLDDNDVAIRFLRMCREPLVEFFREYDILLNYVDARNEKAKKWLTYMGFNIRENPVEYGLFKMPFHRFTMVRK